MKEEQHQFLRLVGQAPARLTVEQAAWLLGQRHPDFANFKLANEQDGR